MMFSARNLCVLTALLLGIVIGKSTDLLRADSDRPQPHVFELRTYTTLDGRLPALNNRFQNHTMKLFEKHGMKNVIYLTPVDKDGMPVGNKLVYLLAHQSQEAARASFAAFGKDPEWIAAKEDSEKDGKIVAGVESQYFVPTAYSPMK